MSAACSRRAGLIGAGAQEGFDIGRAASAPVRCRRSASRTSSKRRPAASSFTSAARHTSEITSERRCPTFSKAAAVARQRVAFDGDQDFAGLERGLAGTGDEIRERHAAADDLAVVPRRQLDLGLMRDQGRGAVGGRRSIDDIAADGRGLADLVVGEPHRAARHAGQRARERRDRRGSAGSAWRRRCARGASPTVRSRQLGDAGHIDQHRNIDVAGAPFARPRQRIGRARDQPVTAVVGVSMASNASSSEAGIRYSSQWSMQYLRSSSA